jgi:lipopolysaccharide/colanic/teichoic acid biosynthesis glycosyltransferase
VEAHHFTFPYDERLERRHPAAEVAARGIEIVAALLVLVFLAPLLLAVALAVRLDSSGPMLFRQRRLGHGRRPFTVFKFRTMSAGADHSTHQRYVNDLIAQGRDCTSAAQQGLYKIAGDPRVTRVGSVLRRWSLDELPQLWNVVRGDMSLVGPRPVVPYETERYPAWYHERFTVKPGLTGLWQVSGRNQRTYEEMVRLDIEYARRRSLRLDLVILIKTVWAVLSRRGVA